MRKDVGSYSNLGFGIPPQQGVEQTHTGEGSNFIQRALDGHPIMRFFTIAAASAVGMHVAGKVVREGGLKLAEYAQEAAKDLNDASRAAQWTDRIHGFRRIESLLDDFQGVTRSWNTDEVSDPLELVRRDKDKVTGRLGKRYRETVNETDSFAMRASAMLDGDPDLTRWTMRNDIQRRLISQARRLPYEAPGFYLANKAVIEPLTGQNKEPRNQVNWKNPVDVIGDFAYQTTKNLAMNILPFDLGFGAAKTGYRQYAMDAMAAPGTHLGFLSVQQLLKQVGVESANVLDKTVKFTEQTLGAFSTTISEASNNGKTFAQFVRSQSTQAALINDPKYSNAGFARKLWLQFKSQKSSNFQATKDVLNTMPTPFKGMAGGGLQTFRNAFRDLGVAHDDWQDLLAGKSTMKSLAKLDGGAQRVENLKAYMIRGGSSSIEQYGAQSFAYGRGGAIKNGKINPEFYSGNFYQARMRDTYKGVLTEELLKTGVGEESAAQFVRAFGDNIKPMSKRYSVGEQLHERFRLPGNTYQGPAEDDWWNNLTGTIGKHVKYDSQKLGLKEFKKAVYEADRRFAEPGFRGLTASRIASEWDYVHRNVLPGAANQTIGFAKKPFNMFEGNGLQINKDFLIRKTAQHLGIKTIDDAGNALGQDALKTRIYNRGINPDNLARMRGFLIDKKEIRNPWGLNGAGSIGWRSLTVDEAVRGDFFAARSKGERAEIDHFIKQRTYGPLGGAGHTTQEIQRADTWDLKMNRVYVGPNGKVFNLDRVFARALNFNDTIASDFHTPLVQLNPMQLAGHPTTRAMRNKGAFIYASGDSVQPIAMAAGKDFKKPDFYLWMKSSPNRSKGTVVGITGDGTGNIIKHSYAGIYRPFSTDSGAMAGRLGNIFMGARDTPGSQTQEKAWKRRFNVATDQENNLFGGKDSFIGRWIRGRKGAPEAQRNEFTLARALSDPKFNPASLTPDQSDGIASLLKSLRQSNFSQRTMERMVDELGVGADVKTLLKTKLGLKTADELFPDLVKRTLNEDLNAVGDSPQAVAIRRLQSNLRNLLNQSNDKPWNLSAAPGAQTLTVSRRIDVLRGEFYKYMMVQPSELNNFGADTIPVTIERGIQNLERLFKTGAISSAERAEGRAAFLSLQFENANNQVYQSLVKEGVQRDPFMQNRALAQTLFGADAPNADMTRELLGEYGSYEGRFIDRKFSRTRRKFARFGEAIPYEKPDVISATGASTAFVPTMATAFGHNPKMALAGIMGLNWRNPEAFSSGVLPAAHMVTRLNRYFENFGLGLDPYRYGSPMSMFAKGMVGQRVLPIVAAGSAAMAVDRTLGAYTHKKDIQGNRVYRPLVLGAIGDVVAGGQIALAGLIPGGQTASEKKEELLHGEVPIRAGRYWMLGSTPFKGGRIQYFRPSWLQRLRAGGSYTPEMNETPIEKLLFGYDYSPLRPFDPYRRERQDYQSRPYPVTGDYFTGPWGPLTPLLNATIGRVLKPRFRMHKGEEKYVLGAFNPVGDAGAYFPQVQPYSNQGGFGTANATQQKVARALSGINDNYSSAAGGRTPSGAQFYGSLGMASPRGTASSMVRATTTNIAQSYSAMAETPAMSYGVPANRGFMSPRVISSEQPLKAGSTSLLARRFGYQTQEMAGIYGFSESSIRERLGLGGKDLAPIQSVLEPASRGYSSSRTFWNLGLGGIGDIPLPFSGQFSNLEMSEIVRRFVPKEQSGMSYINNIPNLMGKQYPWLPGADYPLANIKGGDPYNAIPDAEIRLPGSGYMRTHKLYSDKYGGQLGLANVHDILGDIAPWSQEYKAIDSAVNSAGLSPEAQAKIRQTRAQVEAMRYKYEFTPYKYKYDDPNRVIEHPAREAIGKAWEWLAHRDTYLNTKLGAPRTAVEDWERNDVYGSTFPKWETPISSFVRPGLQKATQRNPILAGLAGSAMGTLFGTSPEARRIGSFIGGVSTLSASLFGRAYEGITGKRYIPLERRKQLALEENIDLLSYVKANVAANVAASRGDMATAAQMASLASKTMYGANLNGTPEQLAMSIPDRKREHFRAMLYAPKEERERILSTAPRLERRIFEAAWGMPVEERPDLNEYFQSHELPPPDSEIWSPQVNMDTIKIKMGQSIGLDMAQMGFYPQQIQEANLLNPAYPSMDKRSSKHSTAAQLRRLLAARGINGSVIASPSAIPGDRIQLNAGVF